ncbi:MAG: hypothetical protein HKN92_03070 [Chitinophagales bacterium]|nr:hypothetical protein [Chitinophagales bacterium]
MEKACLSCGKLIRGRADKKFCDLHCKNIFNNALASNNKNEHRFIDKLLRKNERILKKLCPKGKAIVRKETLDQLAYDYNYFHSIFITKSKNIYYLCYNYGFSPTYENNVAKVIIIQRQAYMDSFNPWKYLRSR